MKGNLQVMAIGQMGEQLTNYNKMTCYVKIEFITEELFTKNTNITG